MIISILRKKNFVKKILNFIYYLRYLIFIFVLAIILLLIIPKLFKYVNKIDRLNFNLKNQHGITIKNFDKIQYKIFPLPNLEIKNSQISVDEKSSNIKVEKLIIFTNLKSLYISNEIFFKKIKFEGIFLGHNISGHYVPQKNTNLLYFKVKSLGIESKIFLNNKKKLPKPSGIIKLKVLDQKLLLNFDFDKDLKFKNAVYKNKNIHANSSGQFNFEPFFNFKILTDIKKINLDNIKFKQLYHFIIDEMTNKKLNGELTLNHLTKKGIGKMKGKNNINIIFENGNIALKNSTFQLANLNIKINSNLKKYPSNTDLDYELFIETENINNFFKTVNIDKDKSLKETTVLVKGNINLDAQKYYFDKITINKKSIDKKKLINLKNYLEKNTHHYFVTKFNKILFYSFLKDLIEFI